MTRVTGTVVAILDGQRIVVDCSSAAQAGCAACGSGRGCRAPLAAAPGAALLTLDMPRDVPAPGPGDMVALETSDTGLLRAAARLYLPPLAGLLLGPVLMRSLGLPDGVATLAAACAGLLGGLALARAWIRTESPRVRLIAADEPGS